MIFNFLVLINLAVVNTIGSSNPSLNPYLRQPLPDDCKPFVEEKIKHFNSCQVSERSPIINFGLQAVPYVCLISLDVAAELCKEPELFTKLGQPNKPESVCPMGYALETSNLNVNITTGVTYMTNEKNCNAVCTFSLRLFSICEFIARANEIIKEGRSIGESLDHMKGDDIQAVHLLEKGRTDNIIGGDGISEDVKSAQDIKPKFSPKLLQDIVQSMTDNKSDINKPVAKTEGVTAKKTTNATDLALKPDLESKRPDGSSYKAMNDSNSSNVSVNKTIFKSVTSANNDNYNVKPIEMNKSQDLASNKGDKGDTDSPETESSPPPQPPQPPLENDYSSKIQQSNVNVINNNNNNVNSNNNNNNNDNNNNVNSNNNNMEFEDDSALKTPHDEGEDDDNNNEEMDKSPLQDTMLEGEPQFAKSMNRKIYSGDKFFQAEDSHFFVYFLTILSIIIIGYVIYHNKNKILAYALEGRRNKNGRRRPTSASYRKLDCNLEEAIASNPSNTSVTNVVY